MPFEDKPWTVVDRGIASPHRGSVYVAWTRFDVYGSDDPLHRSTIWFARSRDGGRTFQKVLYKDENTGGNDVDIDPSNPDIVYATLWEERQGPWENAVWAGTGGGIFKSTDGGTTWAPLTKGLPVVVQANLAISPANPRRIYAVIQVANTTPLRDDTRARIEAQGLAGVVALQLIGGAPDAPVLKAKPGEPMPTIIVGLCTLSDAAMTPALGAGGVTLVRLIL